MIEADAAKESESVEQNGIEDVAGGESAELSPVLENEVVGL
jgi:hypothetical protein